MAYKLDVERPLFLGQNPARQGTVVDRIRLAVSELNTGEGVKYPELESYLLSNYTPAKSQNYNASFVKSYVRDAVGKYDYLSHEDTGVVYAAVEGPAPREPRAPRVPKSRLEILEVAKFIHTAGEVASAEDVVNTNITVEDIAQELGRRKVWVEKKVTEGVAADLLRLEIEEGRSMVYLTDQGFAAVSAVAESQESGETSPEEISPELEPA